MHWDESWVRSLLKSVSLLELPLRIKRVIRRVVVDVPMDWTQRPWWRSLWDKPLWSVRFVIELGVTTDGIIIVWQLRWVGSWLLRRDWLIASQLERLRKCRICLHGWLTTGQHVRTVWLTSCLLRLVIVPWRDC